MRKLNLITILAICLLLPLSLMAQNPSVKKLMDKYKGKDGFTSVNISKELLEMATSMGRDNARGRQKHDSSAMAEEENFFSRIKSLTVLTFENEDDGDKPKKSKNKDLRNEFYNDILKTFPIETYKELLSVDGSDKTVKIVYKNPDNENGELLIIVNDDNSTSLVHIDGAMDMKSMGMMSHFMRRGEWKGLIGMEPPGRKHPNMRGPNMIPPKGKHHIMPKDLPPPDDDIIAPPEQKENHNEKKGE